MRDQASILASLAGTVEIHSAGSDTRKAGKTHLEVSTMVRVTHIADVDDRDLIGVEGEITHPFPGLMQGNPDQYVAGLYVTEESARLHGIGSGKLGMPKLNLCIGDKFEVIEPSDDLDADTNSPTP